MLILCFVFVFKIVFAGLPVIQGCAESRAVKERRGCRRLFFNGLRLCFNDFLFLFLLFYESFLHFSLLYFPFFKNNSFIFNFYRKNYLF